MSVELSQTKQSALKHFLAVDQKLARLATHYLPTIKLPQPQPPEKRGAILMRSIVGQQISTKAATSIWQRLQPRLFLADNRLGRPNIGDLKNNGASATKAKSLLALNQALRSGDLDLKACDNWSDSQVIDHLITYPGVGLWTAEMFLISALGRPDVFSLRDFGLRKALSQLHNLPAEINQLKPLADQYSPHGTLAALICWQWLDTNQSSPKRPTKQASSTRRLA